MSSSTIEVLDANVVVLLGTPLTQINAAPLFQADELKPYMKGVSISQGLQLDTASGVLGPMFAFESMQSQRTVNIAPNRIEAHDRSGKAEFDADSLAKILSFVMREMGTVVTAAGANFEVTFTLSQEQTAAEAIASKLFRPGADYVPGEAQPAGGTGRIFLKGAGNVRYTIAIEPRLNNPDTSEIWMTSNANVITEELPSVERLAQLIRDNRGIIQHVAHSLFSVEW